MKNETISVRLNKQYWNELRKLSATNGASLTWQVNYAVEMYLLNYKQSKEAAKA